MKEFERVDLVTANFDEWKQAADLAVSRGYRMDIVEGDYELRTQNQFIIGVWSCGKYSPVGGWLEYVYEVK